MKYGYFDDQAREYVITRPDTPLPWINYLGCEDYFGLISNTAGGYSFYRDARLRRITRYRYNNVPFDLGGRYIYLRDNGAGKARVRDLAPTILLVAFLAAHPERPGRLHLPPRHGLHHHRLYLCRHSRRNALLRAARPKPGNLAAHHYQPAPHACRSVGVLQHRILPVGWPGRPEQLPAQFQHRAGGDRG